MGKKKVLRLSLSLSRVFIAQFQSAAVVRRPRAAARPDRPAFGAGLVRSGRPRRRRKPGTGRARRAAAAGRPRGVGR